MFSKYYYDADPHDELITDEQHFPWISAFILKTKSETMKNFIDNNPIFQQKKEEIKQNSKLLNKDDQFNFLMLRIHFDTFDKFLDYKFINWFFNKEKIDIRFIIENYWKKYFDICIISLINEFKNEVVGCIPPLLYAQYDNKETKKVFAMPIETMNKNYRDNIINTIHDTDLTNWNLNICIFLLLKEHYNDNSFLFEKVLKISNEYVNRMVTQSFFNLLDNYGDVVVSNFLSKLKLSLGCRLKEMEIYPYNFNVFPDEKISNFQVFINMMQDPKNYDSLMVDFPEKNKKKKFSFEKINMQQVFYFGKQYLLLNNTIIRLYIIPDEGLLNTNVATYYINKAFEKATYLVTFSKRKEEEKEFLFAIVPSRDFDFLVSSCIEAIIQAKDNIFQL